MFNLFLKNRVRLDVLAAWQVWQPALSSVVEPGYILPQVVRYELAECVTDENISTIAVKGTTIYFCILHSNVVVKDIRA